jgi:hypothetical protein
LVFLKDLNHFEERNSSAKIVMGYLPTLKKIIYMESIETKIQYNDLILLTDSALEKIEFIYNKLKSFFYQNFEEKILLQSHS